MHKFEKYSSYKESGVEWLGVIPEHWEVIKLGYFFRAKKGINAAKLTKEFCGKVQGNYNVYSGQTENNGVMDNIDFFEFDYEKEGCLFTTTVGAKAMTLKYLQEKFSLSQNCMIMFSSKNVIDIKFFYYHLQPLFLYERKFIPDHMQASFRMEDFYQFKSALPPKEEQTKIASFLDKKTSQIDKAISQKEKLIELLKERRQITINEAVTKGLDKDVEFKDSGVEWIGEIPKHWEVKKLKNIFKFNKGLTITRENLQDEGVFCVNYGEIHSKYGFEVNPQIHSLKCVSESYLEKNRGSLLKNGDFIFADTSEDIEGSGNFTYLNSDLQTFAGYHTIICRSKNDIFSRFFAYEFESLTFRNQIRSKVKGVKVYSITQGLLKDLTIWLPPKNEQQKIVKYIEVQTAKIDKAIELQQNYIAKLKEYKASLIDSVVTGKVRVD